MMHEWFRTRKGRELGAALSLLLLAPPLVPAEGRANLPINSVMSVAEKLEAVIGQPCQLPACQVPERLVYHIPEMDQVTIVNLTYDEEEGMTADLFYPPGIVDEEPEGARIADASRLERERLPVIILPMGFRLSNWLSEHTESPRSHTSHIDTMALFAAYGMVAISYDTEAVDAGFERLVNFLLDHEDELGLDTSRLGLYSWSGHGRLAGKAVGIRLLASRLRCVVSFHSDIQVMTVPRRTLGFYVVHSDGMGTFDQYGLALARRMKALGHEVVEIGDTPFKNFHLEWDTPRMQEIVAGAAEFARSWLAGTSDQ